MEFIAAYSINKKADAYASAFILLQQLVDLLSQ